MSTERSCSHSWKYDVFLSFRGEDTRKNFTDHLYNALNRRGFEVFKDDSKLEKGKLISPELSKAIEDSRISIVIFSKNYASSTWCLNELIKIVECMNILNQIVIPIFYQVDPSMVRKQTGDFEEALDKHEAAFDNKGKVKKWRAALTNVANLSGWNSKDRHESEFIQNIVNDISRKLSSTTLSTLEDLVGINSRLKKLRSLMDAKSNDVCIIGIPGMGGIGKTTIARAIFELISCEFEGSSFLANVRETSKTKGLTFLQAQLLSQILGEDTYLWDEHQGISMIRSRLQYKKVLIVVDDVDDIEQLTKLTRKRNWFGLGSHIIITTRDEQLLRAFGVDNVYKIEELNDDEALELFSLKAFKNNQPPKEFKELSKLVVKYVGGLPLALKVLGPFFAGRKVDEWESALQRLGRGSEKKGILDQLQISFDGLEELEKKIFLDVACFFKGKNKDYVARILDACGYYPVIGVRVLIDKSLLTVSKNNEFCMHDLLQEMGQKIVKEESPNEPGKRSRLWDEADIQHIFAKNSGTELVEGLKLEKEVQLGGKANVFSKMTNLRLLIIHDEKLSKGLEYLSDELRLLEWDGYALKSLPSSFKFNNLVQLKMHHSRIEVLWKEIKPLNNLKVIHLNHSKNLYKMPDFTNVPNLEELILEGCSRLREIHHSLLVHEKLTLLNLKDCTSLLALPRDIAMKSLKKLVLSGCSKLKKFPQIVRGMECLSELFLDGTPIKELPFPVEHLKGLDFLSLRDCRHLVSLPCNVNGLKSLKTLDLSGCSKLENVPENLGQTQCLEKLDVSGTAIRPQTSSIFILKNLRELSFRGCKGPQSNSWNLSLPFNLLSRRRSDPIALTLPSLSGLRSLKRLNLSDCNLGEGAIPDDIGELVSLEALYLGKNNFVSVPARIRHLSRLTILNMQSCEKLRSLPELPCNLDHVEVDNCTSLERISNALKSCEARLTVSCVNCSKLLDSNSVAISMMKKIPNPKTNFSIFWAPGSEIPWWFSDKSEGTSISVNNRSDLKLKGYVFSAVFLVHKDLPALPESAFFHIHCSSEGKKLSVVNCYISDDDFSRRTMSDHVLLLYVQDPNIIRASSGESYGHTLFEFQTVQEGLEVIRCGAYPMYEQEEGEFTSGNLNEACHQDFTASEMDSATTKRSVAEDYDGAEPSGSGSFDEEPQPKRQRNL